MYFSKIKLKNWGGLYDSELSLDLDERLNVISGPNESGKSTTLEAIRLALSTKASSRKQAVRDSQPWNTDLKPHLEIEFRTNGKDYRLEKTYLKSSGNASFSERLEQGEWTKLAEDDEAHSRFLKTLNLTESEEFFRTLWVPQGENLGLKVSEGLQTRLEEAVGAATSELGEMILEYAVKKVGNPDTDGWLTSKQRDPRTGSPWKTASESLQELREQLTDLQEEREKHFDRLEEISELREEQGELEEEFREKKEQLEDRKTRKEEWDEFRELKRKAASAEEWYQRLMKSKQGWDDQMDKIENKDKEIVALEGELEELEEKKQDLKSAEDEKRNRYKSTRKELEKLKTKESYLTMLRAQKLNERIEMLGEEIEDLKAPETGAFEELKIVHKELSRKRSQLEASELSIDFSPETEASGKLKVDGEEEGFELLSGEKMEKSAAKSFDLDLDGVGSLHVETGMERALEAKEEIKEHERRLQKAFKDYHVSDWSELEGLYKKAELKRDKKFQLSDVRDGLKLEDAESIDEKTLVNFREKHSEQLNRGFLTALNELEEGAIKNRIKSLASEIEKKEDRLEAQKEIWESQKGELEELQGKFVDAKNEMEREKRLKRREVERLIEIKEDITEFDERFVGINAGSMVPDADFDRKNEENCELYQELKKAWGEARDEKDELEHEAERNEPGGQEVTEGTLEELEGEVEKLDEQLRALDGKINRLQGRIGDTADGLHERIRSKKEEIEKVKRQLESHKKETRSHELLRLALKEAKERTSREYLEPIKEKVVPWVREMTGNRYESVNFNTDLKPDSMVRDRRNAEAGKGELSFGTREQLSFLTRLAMAEVIAGEERIPVIFDDSLVNTDSQRMKYARRFLKEAAESCQIILFTCHGDDYRWGGEANEIELNELP